MRCKPLYDQQYVTSDPETDGAHSPLYDQLIEDLKVLSLPETIIKWNAWFANNQGVIKTLIN